MPNVHGLELPDLPEGWTPEHAVTVVFCKTPDRNTAYGMSVQRTPGTGLEQMGATGEMLVRHATRLAEEPPSEAAGTIHATMEGGPASGESRTVFEGQDEIVVDDPPEEIRVWGADGPVRTDVLRRAQYTPDPDNPHRYQYAGPARGSY